MFVMINAPIALQSLLIQASHLLLGCQSADKATRYVCLVLSLMDMIAGARNHPLTNNPTLPDRGKWIHVSSTHLQLSTPMPTY